MDVSQTVPPHLRQYVVTQDYDAYTERDQAVWRFVLLQTYARLARTGHEAYVAGFSAAGISVDHIPRIAEMNERLSAHGFGAVCVDGFIPPRVFQAFQARGFLPIAADIRTVEHLAYTPAPDIIHEAAGHAPFLAHPAYAHYLRRIGSVSEKAFANAYDRELYEAVYLLSEVKEDPASRPEQIARAEGVLAELTNRAPEPSEAARMARLYWWTVEYGLQGTPEDYRLYGAGLLSSLGEGHFCHEKSVQKLPLTAACIDVGYDITRPQPQLFVVRDFEALERVLEEVEATLSHKRGGVAALEAARLSGEACTLELDTGAELCGVISKLERAAAGEIAWVELTGPCTVGSDRAVHPSWPRADRYVLPLGATTAGAVLTADALTRSVRDGRLELAWRSGLRATGRIVEYWPRSGRPLGVLLADFELTARGKPLVASREPFPLLLAERVVTAAADQPQGYHAQTLFADRRVPKPRTYTAAQAELITLQARVHALMRAELGSDAEARIAEIYAVLETTYPDEWLLRWNLLWALQGLGANTPLADDLERQLSAMEIRFGHREPIATGLRYLRGLSV